MRRGVTLAGSDRSGGPGRAWLGHPALALVAGVLHTASFSPSPAWWLQPLALAWLMARPGVTAPIASATTPAQVDSLIRSASVGLDAADLGRLDAASA